MELKDRVAQRVNELKEERGKIIKELNEQAARILAPYEAVIAELEGLLLAETPPQSDEK